MKTVYDLTELELKAFLTRIVSNKEELAALLTHKDADKSIVFAGYAEQSKNTLSL